MVRPEDAGLRVGRLDHVGIAVPDLEEACRLYVDVLGGTAQSRETVVEQGVEVAFVAVPGSARIELIAPLDDSSPVARFLARRGPGMHHVCFRVPDLDEALDEAVRAGVELIDRRPRRGAGGHRIAFLHPRALGGVLVELKEKGD